MKLFSFERRWVHAVLSGFAPTTSHEATQYSAEFAPSRRRRR